MTYLTEETELQPVSFGGLQKRYMQLRRQYEHQAKIISAIGAVHPECTYIINRDLRFIYASPSLLKFWNKSPEEIIGKTYAELGFPADKVELHQAQLTEALNGKVVSGANAFESNDLQSGFFQYTIMPVFDDLGYVEHIVGSIQDTRHITTFPDCIERKRQVTETFHIRLLESKRRILSEVQTGCFTVQPLGI